MKRFVDVVQSEQARIAAFPAGTDDKTVNSAKVELRALELLHGDLSKAAAIASDLAAQVASGAGKEYTPPTVDSIIQVATLFGAYLPLAYQRMVRSGELPIPLVAQGGDDDDDLQQPS
jgi:hypothetical protein